MTDTSTGLVWFKSSYSSGEPGSDCVEVATTPLAVHVRDSKDTSVPALTLDPAAWSAFVVFAAAG
ncbi:DUF397 domain-containing protein [Streptomyces sp. NPDC049597]|uniref:DUF397 domain-containing protein n=1 Tax=Streptomyces sp. NPDC049597 TaxID=3155276 RepID=UPI00342A1602